MISILLSSLFYFVICPALSPSPSCFLSYVVLLSILFSIRLYLSSIPLYLALYLDLNRSLSCSLYLTIYPAPSCSLSCSLSRSILLYIFFSILPYLVLYPALYCSLSRPQFFSIRIPILGPLSRFPEVKYWLNQKIIIFSLIF